MKKYLIAVFAVILALGAFIICSQSMLLKLSDGDKTEIELSSLAWQEKYDLGVRYLSEGNYEEAILAFEAAIEIDPKRAEAYLGLADAYTAAGDEGGAQETLERGLAETNDDAIRDRISVDLIDVDNFMLRSELLVNGVPFYQLSIYDVRDMFENPDADELAERDYISYSGVEFSAYSHKNATTLGGFNYYYWYGQDGTFYGMAPGFRGIQPKDDMETVLRKIGVTEQGIQKLRQSIRQADFTLADWVELPDQTLVYVSYNYRPDITDPKYIYIHWDTWPIEGEVRRDVEMQIYFQEDESLSMISFACQDTDGAMFWAG